MPVGKKRNCRKDCTWHGVTLNINASAVIRKIATEAVSPSLSSFEGHFAAQRQMPTTLPERGAHPLSQRAGSAADRREKSARNKRECDKKSLCLKVDLTLGCVTTDQNPLKAIDHFHYSSHVPHLETVYQTQRVCLHSVHTLLEGAHTLKHTQIH